MRRLTGRLATICLITALMAFGLAASGPRPEAWAYIDQGPVGVEIAQGEIALETGQDAAIACTITPEYSDQLSGCGMATCPQNCTEGCLDENGQCVCGGRDYQRWYTQVTTMSTDPSVARAGYSGGVLSVSAYEPGQATITISTSLRQFQGTSVTLHVTVSLPPQDDFNETVDSGDYESDGGGGSDGGQTDGAGGASQDEAHTNVVNGTGDAKDANLTPDAADAGTAYDKPAAASAPPEAAADAQGAPQAAPEAPGQSAPDAPEPAAAEPAVPDAARPVTLYELEEATAPEAEGRGPDAALALLTSVAACAFVALGAAFAASAWRRQRSPRPAAGAFLPGRATANRGGA